MRREEMEEHFHIYYSGHDDYLPVFLRAYLPNKVIIIGYMFIPWVQFWK